MSFTLSPNTPGAGVGVECPILGGTVDAAHAAQERGPEPLIMGRCSRGERAKAIDSGCEQDSMGDKICGKSPSALGSRQWGHGHPEMAHTQPCPAISRFHCLQGFLCCQRGAATAHGSSLLASHPIQALPSLPHAPGLFHSAPEPLFWQRPSCSLFLEWPWEAGGLRCPLTQLGEEEMQAIKAVISLGPCPG